MWKSGVTPVGFFNDISSFAVTFARYFLHKNTSSSAYATLLKTSIIISQHNWSILWKSANYGSHASKHDNASATKERTMIEVPLRECLKRYIQGIYACTIES